MRSSLLPLLAALCGCPGPDGSGEDPCSGDGPVQITLGAGVGGTFVAFVDAQEVGLSTAPQGGFGVTVLIRTHGLVASDTALVDIQLDTEIDGALAGTFLQEDVPLLCAPDDGGTVYGVVVGFDPQVYKSNDDLLALDGELVDLVVTVIDETGASGTARQPVTVIVGG